MKHIYTHYIIYILLTLVIAPGCNSDRSDDNFPRNVDLYMRYMADGNQFSSLCKISFADTLAEGEPDTANYDITINNKDLKKVILNGGVKNYNLLTKMNFKDKFEIKLKGPDGKILAQSTRMNSIDSIRIDEKVNVSEGLTLQYFGKELNANESLILMLISSDDKTFTTTIQGPASSNFIQIKPDDLKILPEGPASIYLIRTYNDEEVNGKMHFFIRNEYFSRSKEITLIR